MASRKLEEAKLPIGFNLVGSFFYTPDIGLSLAPPNFALHQHRSHARKGNRNILPLQSPGVAAMVTRKPPVQTIGLAGVLQKENEDSFAHLERSSR